MLSNKRSVPKRVDLRTRKTIVFCAMNKDIKHSLKLFLIELAVYAVLVLGYFFLVLHFLGTWLFRLFEQNKKLYAFVALGLIIGQGVMLEMLTSALLRFIRSETED